MHNLFLKEMRDKQLASMGKGIVLTNVPDIRSMMRKNLLNGKKLKTLMKKLCLLFIILFIKISANRN